MAKSNIYGATYIACLYCDRFKRERQSCYVEACLSEIRLPSDKLGRTTQQQWWTGEPHIAFSSIQTSLVREWRHGRKSCENPNSIFTLSFENERNTKIPVCK